jgi:hypothetical protein
MIGLRRLPDGESRQTTEYDGLPHRVLNRFGETAP